MGETVLFMEIRMNQFSLIEEWIGIKMKQTRELGKQSDSSLNKPLDKSLNTLYSTGCLASKLVAVVKLFDGRGDVEDRNSDDYPLVFI
ncbi:hypothetical protein C5167_005712 [Papaver somniferum]|uniref:Uncharacterized protein n=1 Tax=Papaver somniferum TaxID=3469 RepID=A0A4Y7JEE0_PAPSO|nr:hypothetical protein C5167_005712 [Papaver somniferum]